MRKMLDNVLQSTRATKIDTNTICIIFVKMAINFHQYIHELRKDGSFEFVNESTIGNLQVLARSDPAEVVENA
jgi:hypothetical protein